MALQVFLKTLVPLNSTPLTKSYPYELTSLDGIAIQPIYTDGTPAAVIVPSASISGNVFTSTAHGLSTGLVGQMTTSGTLPSGLAVSTNYYVIVLTPNTFELASSLSNALAGTPITLGSAGTGNQTFTPTSLSFVMKLQASNNGINWVDIPTTSVTIISAGTTMYTIDPIDYQWINLVATATSGVLSLTVLANGVRRTFAQ